MTDMPVLRVARPTARLNVIAAMYREGLELDVLASFEDHAGFDGVILGTPGGAYHIEFTQHRGHPCPDAPTKDNLLVLYIPEQDAWHHRCERLLAAGFKQVESYNPFWEQSGTTFEDPDGYRVVIERSDWDI